MALICASCKRTDLTESDFSVLSLHILKLNPNARSNLRCANCLAGLRGSPPVSPRKTAAAAPATPAFPPPPPPPAAEAVSLAAAKPVSLAAAKPASQFSVDDAFDLGSAILETSSIAPSDAGSDDDLEMELAAAGLDAEEEDIPFEDPRCLIRDLAAPDPAAPSAANALTVAALSKHEQRTESIERRQFN